MPGQQAWVARTWGPGFTARRQGVDRHRSPREEMQAQAQHRLRGRAFASEHVTPIRQLQAMGMALFGHVGPPWVSLAVEETPPWAWEAMLLA